MREEHWPALIVASEEAILDRAHQDRNLVMPPDPCDECTTANIITLLCPFRLVFQTSSNLQYIQLRIAHQLLATKRTGDICSSERGVRLASDKHSNYYSTSRVASSWLNCATGREFGLRNPAFSLQSSTSSFVSLGPCFDPRPSYNHLLVDHQLSSFCIAELVFCILWSKLVCPQKPHLLYNQDSFARPVRQSIAHHRLLILVRALS